MIPAISTHVWNEKYRWRPKDGGGDQSIQDTWLRVARGVATNDGERAMFADILNGFRFLPAGRILANAGTDRRHVTMMNCFCMGTIEDSLEGIFDTVKEAALTQKQGGGVGFDFSTIRPIGAHVAGVGAPASGPVSFMHVLDATCRTIMSAGQRRGAQMGVMKCSHPDILNFIEAKRTKGHLENFNISVGILDAFMQEVERDGDWPLAFDGTVHGTVEARYLWDAIMKSAYNHAEPGVLFLDTVNRMNNLRYCETIAASNPCVTADTWVTTSEGARQVKDIVGVPTSVMVDGKPHATTLDGFFKTGEKPVVRLSTTCGRSLRLTGDHKVLTGSKRLGSIVEREWKRASDLLPGESVVLHRHLDLHWPGKLDPRLGYPMGLLVGNGHVAGGPYKKAILATWITKDDEDGVAGREDMRYTEEVVGTLPNLRGFKGWHPRPGGQAYLMSTRAFTEVAESLGVVHGDKHNLDIIEREGSEFYENYLCGLFDADGTVGGCRKKGVSVRLSQSNLPFLQGIQRMLGRLGINSTLYADRHAEGFTLMPDGKGGSAMYPVKATHDLCIANDNLQIFASRIGFKRTHKAKRLEELLSGYKRTPNHDVFLTEVASVVEEGVEDVYDVSVPGVMAFDANGLYVHNCGEAVLPPYGVCLLGSVNLTAHLTDEFVGGSFEIDMPRLRDTVTKAVRFLDNVIDVSGYPLKQQWVEAMVKRRLGIGFTGLADALIAMKLRYGSQEAVQTTEYIVKEMTCAAYRASIDLAKERGPFEMFQRDRHLESNFVKRLPDDILDGIAGHGIRNSHLMSVAPTGTISLFAGNVSSGIEPVFSWKYTRNIRTGVGDETRPHDVVDWAYARHIERGGDPDRLPEWFVTADALTPKEHLETMAAAQKWVDQAISKTVNVPADIPYEDFKDIYRRAYSLGLKGCTVYRPNPNLKSVLEKPKEPEQPDTAHPRTMALHARPECLTGLTYKVKTPLSPDAFYVTMNDMVDADGLARPYEMFINTKNLQHLSWIIAMTRLISAVFRREADASFLIEELKSIHDPQGGYFSGGEYVPSLPAEMGRVIERHMKAIGLIPDGETVEVEKVDALPEGVVRSPGPLCPKCGQPSLVMIENCPRCTKCGYSKCG